MAATDPFEQRGRPALVEDAKPKVEGVFSLSKVLAEREEKPPFVFEFDGENYSLPSRIDLRAIAAFQSGRIDQGFQILLGAAQWDRLQAADGVFGDDEFGALFEGYQEHIGEDLGESAASTSSSRKPAKQ